MPAPANTQTELRRSESELNDTEKLILERMKDQQFLTSWHATLLKEKEDNEVFYASEYRFVKVPNPFNFVILEFCILFLQIKYVNHLLLLISKFIFSIYSEILVHHCYRYLKCCWNHCAVPR